MVNRIRRYGSRLLRKKLQRVILDMTEQLMQLSNYYPHAYHAYIVPAYPNEVITLPGQLLAIPPEHPFWTNYCTSVESWVQSGKDDTDSMRRILLETGFDIKDSRKILELGVAGGRLIRHLHDLADTTEIWGVDIWASAVRWCLEHLHPPFHFATTTVIPHLPFADGTFGLVYAGSVFTHLDDLVESWFLELHRVLRPGGRLYFTINDRHAVSIFEGAGSPANRARYIERVQGPQEWQKWLDFLQSQPEYLAFLKGKAQMVTMNRPHVCQVLWDTDCLKARLGPNWRWLSVNHEAYGHQTGVLLERC